ncbi:hypothetical protein M408DRAFT_197429 [Serendipita vermifera MAFF 305830]|uniref:Uncharacterized protein n=1 Tax=Serendipita vermifera MAFF 305830 TaxID=933852 RepID=A0A0C2WIL5_SERVB|nr:hypothetical protein M408DRAFT_197429 [Serendipita vermifera MAFF 305830]
MNTTDESRSRKADRASVDAPDFSLELSGGLESESIDEYNTLESIITLDPEVLASLVVQLRTNLSSAVRERNDARGERDALIGDLAVVQTRLHELESAGEREVEYLNEMSTWRKRCEEAEEQVGLLRSKVEESRRAVMTLQTQSRRLSQLSVPYASSPHAQSFGQETPPRTPAFQKRMSLQVGGSTHLAAQTLMGPPPKGRAHNRRSSVSESDVVGGGGTVSSQSSHAPSSFADSRQPNSDQDHDSSTLSRSASRRHSAMITRPTESLLNPMGAELESLRQELIGVRVELMEAKHEAWEAKEAKEASDVCLKALKEFIAENSIGDGRDTGSNEASSIRGLSLPPLPTDNIADTEEDGEWVAKTPVASHAHSSSVASKKGWGLGFWSSPATTTPAAPASTPKSASNDTALRF